MAVVQSAFAIGSTSPVQATFGSAITAGNALLVMAASDIDITLGAGITRIANNIDSMDWEVGRRALIGGDGTSWGVTFSGTFPTAVQIFELDEAYEQVGTSYHSISGGQATIPIPSITPTQSGTVLAVAASHGSANNGGTITYGNSFTEIKTDISSGTGTTNPHTYSAQKSSTASAAVGTTTITQGTARADRDGVLVNFANAPPSPIPVFVAAGTIAEGTTAALTPGLPAGMVAGDLMLLCSVAKQSTVTIPVPTGWTLVDTATGGTGTAGIDVGTLKTQVAYRIYQAGDSAPSITVSSASPAHHVIIGYTKGTSTDTFVVPTGTNGGDTTAGTGYAVTGAADLSITTNDRLVAVTGNVTDTPTPGTVTLSATSATLAASASRVDDANTSGNDDRLTVMDSLVTAGSSSAAPAWSNTWGGTNAAGSMGATVFVRVRESAAAAASPFFPRRWQPNYRR